MSTFMVKKMDALKTIRAFAFAFLFALSPLQALAIDCDTDGSVCNDAQQTGQTACNSQDLQAGMTAAQMAQAQSLTAQANAANQATTTTGSSTSAQCMNQAALSGILSGLSALKAAACKQASSECSDTCENLALSCDAKAAANPAQAAVYKQHSTAARSKKKMCESYSGNSTLALVQAAALMASMFMNNSCASSASSATPTPVDCTNPAYAQVTQACICAPVGTNPYADPENSICTNGSSVTGTGASLSGSGAITPVSTDSSTDGTLTKGLDPQKPETGTQAMSGGGGGGGLGGGSGGGGALGGGGGGADPSTIDKNVIQGQSGGGGGGLAVGAAGAGGGGEPGGKKGDDGKIDLSQWLPKGKYKALNIGGMSIKADDGITGPMGPSLWEKVSNRYQIQKNTLIPER